MKTFALVLILISLPVFVTRSAGEQPSINHVNFFTCIKGVPIEETITICSDLHSRFFKDTKVRLRLEPVSYELEREYNSENFKFEYVEKHVDNGVLYLYHPDVSCQDIHDYTQIIKIILEYKRSLNIINHILKQKIKLDKTTVDILYDFYLHDFYKEKYLSLDKKDELIVDKIDFFNISNDLYIPRVLVAVHEKRLLLGLFFTQVDNTYKYVFFECLHTRSESLKHWKENPTRSPDMLFVHDSYMEWWYPDESFAQKRSSEGN